MLGILAISGSLRADSTNSALLRAAAEVAPNEVSIDLYDRLGDLPIFNPNLEERSFLALLDLRRRLAAADGLLIASPEYAHGVPGGLKNLLDWAVGWEEFSGKPVALFHTSPYGEHAKAALAEVLKTMSACLIPAANLDVNLRGKKPAEMAAILALPETAAAIRNALVAFGHGIPACGKSAA